MKTNKYQKRFYRDWVAKQNLNFCEAIIEETDVLISSDKKIDKKAIEAEISKYRRQIEDYIAKDRNFLTSLVPVGVDKNAAPIIKDMANAAKVVGVGPMAAVAGAIAEYLGNSLFKDCKDVIIENGGDIFIKTSQPRKIGLYAGGSVLSGKISLEIRPEQTPCGVCCSSGTVGHSLSFGQADAAVVLAKSATLSDACATAVGNLAKTKDDLAKAVEFAKTIPGIKGALVIIQDKLSLWGDIKIT